MTIGARRESARISPPGPRIKAPPGTWLATVDLLDAQAIRLSCGDEQEVFETLRSALQRCLPAQLANVRDALESGNLLRLAESARKLAETLGAFSPVAAGVAWTLEDAGEQRDVERCRMLVTHLEVLWQSLSAKLEAVSITSLASSQAIASLSSHR